MTVSSSFQTNAVRKTLDVNLAQNAAGQFIDNSGNATVGGQPVQRFDLQNDIFRRAYGTEQYVSVSGGGQGTSYFVSGGHFVNEGIVGGNLFRRLNGRARVTQEFGDAVTLQVGGNYTNSLSLIHI